MTPLLWNKLLLLQVQPPIFNGSDYAHGKVRMRAHLKGSNDIVWIVCEKGWVKPEGEYHSKLANDAKKING